MAMRVEIEGIEDVVKQLKRVGVDITDALELIATAGAAVMAERVAGGAPGEIAGSIVTDTLEKSRKRVEVGTGPDKDHFYARYVEFGTQAHEIRPSTAKALTIDGGLYAGATHPGNSERPFMRPAFDGGRGAAEREMAKATAKAGKMR